MKTLAHIEQFFSLTFLSRFKHCELVENNWRVYGSESLFTFLLPFFFPLLILTYLHNTILLDGIVQLSDMWMTGRGNHDSLADKFVEM